MLSGIYKNTQNKPVEQQKQTDISNKNNNFR